ncbi:MAG TPA: thiolase family protein [Thermodesulfobacteriota bacterium]|nr:thiolase family protein [Thermodesulfobacteriota bacterium]
MRKVAIVGLGQTKFKARWPDKTYYELAYDAAKMAIEDAGIDRTRIDCAVYGIYNDFFQRQYQPDAFVHDYIGLGLKAAVRVNTGGATGGSALRIGYAEVASGLYDVCLVLGVEKCSDCYNYEAGMATPEVLRAILYTADMTYDNPAGRTAASGFAIAVLAHQEKYGNPTEVQMAKVSVKNHFNATKNPIAQSPAILTVEQVMKSRKIVEPFKFYDNCLYTEGASAVILASEKVAKSITKKPVWITGVGASADYVMPGNRPNIYTFESSRQAARKAFEMAGIKNPLADLDLAELHDAFTGTEIMAYEDCFFCPEGEGGRLIDDGTVMPEGKLPVNLSGGLIGCGHAVGATGIMQTYEVGLHLRGEAGERQRKNARRGLVQSIGGTLCTWTVCLVLEREG